MATSPRLIGALIVLACGCGRIGFEHVGADGAIRDGGTLDGGQIDGGFDAGTDAGMPSFGPPTPLSGVNTAADEDDPTLTANLLEIHFNRSSNVWRSTRGAPTDPWDPPAAVAELNTGSTETSPEITADGSMIYFASSRGGSIDIWFSTRALVTDVWSMPLEMSDWNTGDFETNATPSADGLGLTFARGPSEPERNLWEVRRASPGASWGTPIARTELDTAGVDAAAMLFLAGRALIYFTDRPGGMGGRDLWMATRTSTALPFDPPFPVRELNTTGDDEDPWISEDGRYIVYSSGGDLYEASR